MDLSSYCYSYKYLRFNFFFLLSHSFSSLDWFQLDGYVGTGGRGQQLGTWQGRVCHHGWLQGWSSSYSSCFAFFCAWYYPYISLIVVPQHLSHHTSVKYRGHFRQRSLTSRSTTPDLLFQEHRDEYVSLGVFYTPKFCLRRLFF